MAAPYISQLPPPPGATAPGGAQPAAAGADISALPAPTTVKAQGPDISGLPAPDISDLPPPPTSTQQSAAEKYADQDLPDEFKSGRGVVTDTEFEKIAKAHGINPEDLRNAAPYFETDFVPRNNQEAWELAAKRATGRVGTAALGIPNWIYKKTQSPDFQRAIDDMRELSDSRKSTLEKAAEFASTLALPVGAGGKAVQETAGPIAKLAKGAALGAGFGGAGGLAESKTGEELSSAARGTAVGAALGTGIEVGVAGLGYLGSKLSAPLRSSMAMQKGIDELAAKTADSEGMMRDIVTGKTDEIADPLKFIQEQIPEEDLKSALDPSTAEGQALRSKLEDGATEADVQKELANQVAEDRLSGFAEDLTGKKPGDLDEAVEAIRQWPEKSGESLDALEDRWDRYSEEKMAQRWAEETGAHAGEQPGFLSRQLNKVSAPKWVYRYLDQEYGNVGAEQALESVQIAKNMKSYAETGFRSKANDLIKEADQDGVLKNIASQANNNLYDALNTGDISKLSPEELKQYQGWRQYDNELLQYVNGGVKQQFKDVNPMNIPRLENHIHHIALPTEELIPAVERQMDSLLEDVNHLTGKNYSELNQVSPSDFRQLADTGSEALDNLQDYMGWKSGSEKEYRNAQDLSRDLSDSLYSKDAIQALESRARGAEAREGEIPDFILDKNVPRVMQRYTFNTLNHLFLRDPLDRMATVATKLDTIGATGHADFVKQNIQDILSVRKGSAAEATIKYRANINRKLEQMANQYGDKSPQAVALRAAKVIPDIFDFSARQLYSNVLGYNIHSIFMHVGTALTRVPLEMGANRYSALVSMRGAADTVLNWSRNIHLAEMTGALPAEFVRGAEQAVVRGVEDTIPGSSMARKVAGGIEAIGQAGMTGFQAGERFNRAYVQGIANMMSHDLASEDSTLGRMAWDMARKNFPLSVQQLLEKNRGDQAAIRDIVANHMNFSSLFSYDRSGMYEYGRVLGRFFSTFSTWPTNIFGQALYETRARGIIGGTAKNLERLAVPYLGLTAANYMLFGGTGKDMPDRAKVIFGAEGMQHVAPVGALHEFASGKIFTPPMVDLAVNGIIRPVMNGEGNKLGRTMDQAFYDYGPLTGLTRFITQDVVTMVTGEKPEGKTFTERTGTGIKKITGQ